VTERGVIEERSKERDKDLYSQEGGIEETGLNKIGGVLERHNVAHSHNVVSSSTFLNSPFDTSCLINIQCGIVSASFSSAKLFRPFVFCAYNIVCIFIPRTN